MSKQAKRAAKGAARRKAVKARPVAKARAKAAPKKKVALKAKAAPATRAAPEAATPAVEAFYLTLDANCTLRETADLQFSLVVANGDPLVVDGGGVDSIDTSGLQLLVALVRRQQQAGRRLEWKAVSPQLRKCGERLGLIDALGLPASAGEAP